LIISKDPKRRKNAILKMSLASLSRGPDAQTILHVGNASIGFNRLEIVGGFEGAQPIYNEDKSLILICNGEVFNYKQLRKTFLTDHTFTTTSDVEAILHLYEKFGEECVRYLEGQFGFAIYDLKRKSVFLGRDRFGIIPLFVLINEEALVVSSSLVAIASSGYSTKNLNPLAIAQIQMFYGPRPPSTIVEDIYQLPPATTAFISFGSRRLHPKKYWDFTQGSAKLPLKEALSASVSKRIDKSKFGIYVSGGIDSSIIAGIAYRLAKEKPVMFSVIFEDKRFDESEYQMMIAKKWGYEWRSIVVSSKKIADNFDKTIRCVETPVTRFAPIPLVLLSTEVNKEGIKYILCGEGADELFMGYPVFESGKASYEAKWNDGMRYVNVFLDRKIPRLLERNRIELEKETSSENPLLTMRKKEITTKLSSYLLSSQGDRVSMANSVEQRFPFLDEEVWSAALNLSKKELFDKFGGKAVLRKVFNKLLPARILSRKKQGYLAPDIDILKILLNDKYYLSILTKKSLEETKIFDYIKVTRLIRNMKKGEDGATSILILILSTQIFYYHLKNA